MTTRTPLGLSLKQKLSTLSLSASAPSSPATSRGDLSFDWPLAGARTQKKKGVFAWTRKDENEYENEDPPSQQEIERVEAVLDKIICQAGVDFETRPMVVITAAALPDPRLVSYDLLLTRLLAHLDAYVENDYTVVFLTAGGRHTPSWNWVWKAYRSLNRKYRKNLKKMYIVHSTWFSKMLFSLAGAVISPKFFRKIQYIGTLSELAENVPITQIDISPAVYQENLKYERQINLPTAPHATVFGVPLEVLMGEYGENGGIPRVVKDCIEYIRECGMEIEGIFRRSPSSALLRQAKEAYDRGHPVSLSAFSDPHIAAVLLKKFFRDLPDPIFHEEMYPVVRNCPGFSGPGDMAPIVYIREQILPALRTDAAEIVISYVFHLLHDISLRSSTNLMDAHNLAVCFTPTLVGSNPAKDVQMCVIPGGPSLFQNSADAQSSQSTTVGMIVKICIERYFEIFEEVVDRSEPLNTNAFSLGPPPVLGEPAEDDSLDDAMLVMPLGPTPPGSNVSSPYPASPPNAWNRRSHRRIGSRTNQASGAVAAAVAAPSVTESTRSKSQSSMGGALGTGSTRRRSIISIEKAVAKAGKRGSITVGKAGGRRSGGAGVEAVNVTVLGFFTPPQENLRTDVQTSSDASAGQSSDTIPKSSSVGRELSEVAE